MSSLNHPRRRLAEGVSSWLLYEFHCNRGELFSEKYIAHPVGSLLANTMNGIVIAEFPHKLLINNANPPKIDFAVFKDERSKNDLRMHETPLAVVETKWISRTYVSPESILYDFYRLSLLVDNDETEGYFVLSGFAKMIKNTLEGKSFQKKNGNKTIIPITARSGEMALRLSHIQDSLVAAVKDRFAKYKDVKLPDSVLISPPVVFPAQGNNLTFSTYCWRIGGKKYEW